jgi:hypothetical protein
MQYNPGPEYIISRNGEFGPRTGSPRGHYGMDFTTAPGYTGGAPEVRAAYAGTVHYVGANEYFGNTVVLRHDLGSVGVVYTLYGHLDGRNMPHPSDTISAGTQIGYMGNTGISRGAHLHFEVITGAVPTASTDGGPLGIAGNAGRVNPRDFVWPNGVFGGESPLPPAVPNQVLGTKMPLGADPNEVDRPDNGGVDERTPATNETETANDAWQAQGGDNNYGYGNPDERPANLGGTTDSTNNGWASNNGFGGDKDRSLAEPDSAPEGPSGGFVTDGSEPGSGFDGIGGPATPSNETETTNDAWQAQGDNNYGYGNPNEGGYSGNNETETSNDAWMQSGGYYNGNNEMEGANDAWGNLGQTETAPADFNGLNNTLFDSANGYDNSATTNADFNGLEGYSGNASSGYDYGSYSNEMESANDAWNVSGHVRWIVWSGARTRAPASAVNGVCRSGTIVDTAVLLPD